MQVGCIRCIRWPFKLEYICLHLRWMSCSSLISAPPAAAEDLPSVCVPQLVLWIRPMTNTFYKPAISQHQGGTAPLTSRLMSPYVTKLLGWDRDCKKKCLYLFFLYFLITYFLYFLFPLELTEITEQYMHAYLFWTPGQKRTTFTGVRTHFFF